MAINALRSTTLLLLTTGMIALPSAALADPKTHKGDPAGNNGTVKIGAVPLDKAPHANQPHVGCTFSLRFFGFDKDQSADITFTGQAPTKAGVLLAQKDVAISDDAAGGGQDADAVLTYTASQLGLTGVAPAKQGWHVKVAVDVAGAPGGAKQKVFWLSCPSKAAAPTSSGSGTAAPEGPATGGSGTTTTAPTTSTTTSPATTEAVAGTTSTAVTGSAGSGTVASTPATTEAGGGQTFGSGIVSANAAAPAQVRPNASSGGEGLARALLPFTGDWTVDTAWAGLTALGLGGAALTAGRKRREGA